MMLERFSYRGWQNAYKISNGVVELITTVDVGPESFVMAFAGARTCFTRSERTQARLVVRSFACMAATDCGSRPRWRQHITPTTPRLKLLSTAMRFVSPRREKRNHWAQICRRNLKSS
jgi:hypothetical protein